MVELLFLLLDGAGRAVIIIVVVVAVFVTVVVTVVVISYYCYWLLLFVPDWMGLNGGNYFIGFLQGFNHLFTFLTTGNSVT